MTGPRTTISIRLVQTEKRFEQLSFSLSEGIPPIRSAGNCTTAARVSTSCGIVTTANLKAVQCWHNWPQDGADPKPDLKPAEFWIQASLSAGVFMLYTLNH